MRIALPYLLILVAAAAGYLLLTDGEENGLGPELRDDGAERTPSDPSETASLDAPTIAVRDRPAPPKRRPPKAVDPRTVPRGRIDVLPVGPDLKPVVDAGLRVDVEPTGRRDWAKRLGQLDAKTGVWVFPKIVAGEVEIIIRGDHVIATKQRAKVKAGETTEVTVHVDLAGAIKYDVVLYDKTRPKQVTLTLFDWQDQPVEAWYEPRALRVAGSPRRAKTVTQGPEGAVFGVPPGHYRLRAVSENDEWDDIEVELEAGKTESVTFELRR